MSLKELGSRIDELKGYMNQCDNEIERMKEQRERYAKELKEKLSQFKKTIEADS